MFMLSSKFKYFFFQFIIFTGLFAQIDSSYRAMTINNFNYWQRSDAYSAHSPSGWNGGIFPSQTASVLYLDGILIGGFSNDGILKVSGTIYRNGLVEGFFDENQNYILPTETLMRRIRTDWASMTPDELLRDAMISYEKSNEVNIDSIFGIIAIEEYASWPSAETLVDGGVDSHLNPSLSQTGMILDNRAGGINLPSYARDYDRFDYWGFDDVVIDFSDSSLTWEYYDAYLHVDENGDAVYQPFAAYRIEPFGGDTLRLFAGFWDSNGDGKWSVNMDEDSTFDWVAPTYGAECWEPIYCVQGYDTLGNAISYDPADEALYIATGAGIDEDGDGYVDYDALSILANSTWGSSTGEFTYPYITAMLFSAYNGPNGDGSYVVGTATDGGSAALPIAGNYDKYGTQLTVSHYFKFTTLDTSFINIDSSQFVTELDILNIQNQYTDDWDNWPHDLGAPFYDLNENGFYDPSDGETPGIANADQVIWYVTTDADETVCNDLYGTDPIDIEMQVSVFGYDEPNNLVNNSLFKLVKIINKGDEELTEAFISIWSDPDVGDYTNDLVGIDTLQEMMFAYNGSLSDEDFDAYELAPPAVGYKLIYGPLVESEGDTGIFNFKEKYGAKNLGLSSFGYFEAGGIYSDPGPYGDTEAAREFYNLMRGFTPIDDLDNPTPWLDENGNETKFPFSGDPVTGAGHIDSGPSDRRMVMNMGPFTLNVGDTVEFVLAIGGGIGQNNINSITELRQNMGESKTHLLSQFGLNLGISSSNLSIPNRYELFQNHPNPFNPITKINIHLPKSEHVQLTVYNILGEEVRTLINSEKVAGEYNLLWDGTNFRGAPVSSGIYFYRLHVGQYQKTKKMLLLR